jgi:hypothetical protein
MDDTNGNMGRPVVLDAAKRAQVVSLVRAGCTKRRAAAYVGVDESTIRRAEKADPTFAQQLVQAEIQLELELVGKVRAEADNTWRAAAWYLERRNPAEYGKGAARVAEVEQKSTREQLEELVRREMGE